MRVDFGEFSWFPIVQVCSCWRKLALDTPILWTDITVGYGSIDLLRDILVRSQEAPLRIAVYRVPERSLEHLKLAVSCFHRAKELVLRFSSRRAAEIVFFEGTFPKSFPYLKSLILAPNDLYGRSMFNPSAMQLPPVLNDLGTVAPLLQQIRILDFQIDWNTISFPASLKSLTITSSGDFSGGLLPSISQVVAVVRSIPMLEHLTLRGLLPIFHQAVAALPFIRQASEMSRLQEMHIKGPPLESAYFVAHFLIPPSASVSLEWSYTCSSDRWPLLVDLLSTHLLTKAAPEDNRQPVDLFTLSQDGVGFYKRGTSMSLASSGAQLYLGFRHDDTARLDELMPLISRLPLRGVSVVATETSCLTRRLLNVWRDIITAMPAVQTFHIGNTAAEHWEMSRPGFDPVPHDIFFLLESSTASNKPDSTAILLPQLHLLSLAGISFRKTKNALSEFKFVEELRAALDIRDAAGHAVQELVLEDCENVDKGDLEFLQQIVPSVTEKSLYHTDSD